MAVGDLAMKTEGTRAASRTSRWRTVASAACAILVGLSLCALPSCDKGEGQPPTGRKTPAEGPTQPEADMVVEGAEATHALGYVKPGSVHTVRAAVRNPEAEPMAIEGIRSGCACMTVPERPKSIPAGDTAVLAIRFEAPEAARHYAERIVLKTDRPGREAITLRIEANIGRPLEIRPKVLELTAGAGDETLRGELRLVKYDHRPYKPVYATSGDPERVTAHIPRAAVEAGGELAIPVTVDLSGVSPGQHAARLHIHTDCPTQSALSATVRYGLPSP